MDYEERQANKRDRLSERAEVLRAEGTTDAAAARDFFHRLAGQPTLPGHHSYRADINRRQKNRDRWDRGFEKIGQADELDRRSRRVGTGGVASDDPDAIAKLRAQLEYVNTQRDEIKAINKICRKHAPKLTPGQSYDAKALTAALTDAGVDSSMISEALKPNYMGKIGFESFQLTNLAAKANRLQKRITDLETMHDSAEIAAQWSGDGWTMWTDFDEGRIFCEIDGRLTRESFASVRNAGRFNWSRRDERFVRKITPAALNNLESLAARLNDLIMHE